MATAPKTKKKRELDIGQVLKAVDLRDYDFYDRLSDKERKELSPYVLMRFISSSNGDPDIQEWFIERTNEFVNKNHWTLANKHDPLLWKLCAAVGPGMTVFHKYMASPKSQLNKFERLLADYYPTYKEADVKLLASLMSDDEKLDFFDSLGFDKKQRKEYE